MKEERLDRLLFFLKAARPCWSLADQNRASRSTVMKEERLDRLLFFLKAARPCWSSADQNRASCSTVMEEERLIPGVILTCQQVKENSTLRCRVCGERLSADNVLLAATPGHDLAD